MKPPDNNTGKNCTCRHEPRTRSHFNLLFYLSHTTPCLPASLPLEDSFNAPVKYATHIFRHYMYCSCRSNNRNPTSKTQPAAHDGLATPNAATYDPRVDSVSVTIRQSPIEPPASPSRSTPIVERKTFATNSNSWSERSSAACL